MKKIAMLMLAFLLAVLPQSAVQAAAQKNVILNAAGEEVEIRLLLPDDAGAISTLRLKIEIGGDTDNLDKEKPLNFIVDKDIDPTFEETRYNSNEHTFSIYLSDVTKLTDKTEFNLGTVSPNAIVDSEFELTLTVEVDGLEYVGGNGKMNQEDMPSPVRTGLQVNLASEKPGDDGAGGSEAGSGSGNSDGTTGNNGSGNGSSTGGQTGSGNNGSVSAGGNDGSLNTDGQSDDSKSSAKTGDENNILLYSILVTAGAVGAGAALVIRKQYRSGKQHRSR